jgi:hypothetical protein
VTHFAIIDRDRAGADAVLLVVEDLAEAEAIAFELRRKDVRVDVVVAVEQGPAVATRARRPLRRRSPRWTMSTRAWAEPSICSRTGGRRGR